MLEALVDVLLPQRVLYVVGLLVVLPVLVELVEFASNVALLLAVEGLVHLGDATLAEQRQEEVALAQHLTQSIRHFKIRGGKRNPSFVREREEEIFFLSRRKTNIGPVLMKYTKKVEK